jgi:LAO/AO transport system kinase
LSPGGAPELAALAAGGKAALAQALAALERAPGAAATLRLLDEAYAAPRAHVVGVTGPPGVGKSTLLAALIAAWRASGRSVGVIADRTRLRTDPEDRGVFVRSMAARDRLGGLAALTVGAMVLMRALYDVVLIETVGVGQSETDVAGAADTVVLCVQPGSGDSLQFMKAGIVEIPQILVVTTADLGEAERDAGGWAVPVLALSALRREGVGELVAALDRHWHWLGAEDRLGRAREAQARRWLEEGVREAFGREGMRRAGPLALAAGESPFRAMEAVAARLRGDAGVAR